MNVPGTELRVEHVTLYLHSPIDNPLSQVSVCGDINVHTPETVTGAALQAPLALAWLNMDYSDYCVLH